MHRTWGTFFVAVLVAVGFVGGMFTQQYLNLNALNPINNNIDNNEQNDNHRQEFLSSLIKEAVNLGNNEDGDAGSSNCALEDMSLSLMTIDDIDWSCFKATFNSFNFRYNMYIKAGTDTPPMEEDTETGQSLKSQFLINLLENEETDDDFTNTMNLDFWVYFHVDWDAYFEYYDEKCSKTREPFKENQTYIIHYWNSGPGTEFHYERHDTLPNDLLKTYQHVACHYLHLSKPTSKGSVENCKRCKPVQEEVTEGR
jgi:hypothetical protein